jgi:predicted enzyme related to lactoylglutathione lyase
MTSQIKNPFTWVEIYVEDMSRAQKFYENVLQIQMIPMQAPDDFSDLEMLSFPWVQGISNNKRIMGKNTNGKISNIFGFAALVLMTVAGLILVYMQYSGA